MPLTGRDEKTLKHIYGPFLLASTESNIATGNSWDSGWVDVEGFPRVRAAIYADQSLDYHVEFSYDGENLDAESSSASTTANTGEGADWPTYGYYCKLVVANNSGSSTSVCRVRMYGVRT